MTNHPEILISVQNAVEAAIAVRYPIGILDLKDPRKGSLGAVSQSARNEILAVNSSQRPLSVAVGELVDLLPFDHSFDPSAIEGWDWLRDFRYAKIGLAGVAKHAPDWATTWKRFREAASPMVSLVGVAYVDWQDCNAPPIEEVFEVVRCVDGSAVPDPQRIGHQKSMNERVMLLDTHTKSQGNIVEILGWRGIETWIDFARRDGVKLVVAGSLQPQHLKRLSQSAPDYIGFRGAVCKHGRNCLSERKLEELFRELGRLKRIGNDAGAHSVAEIK